MTHKCPAPACEAELPTAHFACKPHWFAIPKVIRERIWASYRAEDHDAHDAAMADGMSYLSARYGGEDDR